MCDLEKRIAGLEERVKKLEGDPEMKRWQKIAKELEDNRPAPVCPHYPYYPSYPVYPYPYHPHTTPVYCGTGGVVK